MPLTSRTLKSNAGGGRWLRRARRWGFTTQHNFSGLRIKEGGGASFQSPVHPHLAEWFAGEAARGGSAHA